MSMMRLLAVVGIAGCTPIENVVADLDPILSVAPEVLDIGGVGIPLSGSGSVFVSNAGLADLEVTPTLEGSETFALEGAGELLSIEPDAEVSLNVTFTPETFKDYEATLVLNTNDPDRLVWTVPFTGTGIVLPLPSLNILPANTVEAVDVPPEGPGANPLMIFEIENIGDAPLELGEITLDGDADVFFPTVIPAPGTLVYPNESTTVAYQYLPVDSAGDDAIVHIASNDPVRQDEPVLLVGNGGDGFDRPIAVIDCPGIVYLTGPEWVRFDGTGSSDPAGTELSYQWTTVLWPPGSDRDIPFDPSTESVADLYVDVAGLWTMQLVVTNEFDTASHPALCLFTAEPEDDIHVELSWDGPAADVDLHLSQAGFGLFDVPEDACWCNDSPDWGTVGSDDDARLDIDDISGFGPENINVLVPVAGSYEVWVHHYNDHGDGAIIANVNVWAGGSLVWPIPPALGQRVLLTFPDDDPQEVWHVGTLDWPSGTFTEDTSGNTLTPLTNCQQ